MTAKCFSEFQVINLLKALEPATSHDTCAVCVKFYYLSKEFWLPAQELAEAGSMTNFLLSIGLPQSNVDAINNRDHIFVAWEGEGISNFVSQYSFKYTRYKQALESDVPLGAFAAGIALGMDPEDIENRYRGEYTSLKRLAKDITDISTIPVDFQPYFDWEAYSINIGASHIEHNNHYFSC